MAQWNEEKQQLENINAEGFTDDEVNEGKVFVETLIKEKGKDYASLVTRVTLVRAQVATQFEPGDELGDTMLNKVAIPALLEEYDAEHPIAAEDREAFVKGVKELSDKFLGIGTRAAEQAKAREEAAENGSEAEGSV